MGSGTGTANAYTYGPFQLLDTFHTTGANIYRTFFDSVVARLLIAAGEPQQARHCLDAALALANDTGMHFYDAELLRLRAHTQADPSACHAYLDAAIELARLQDATLFELRAALDDFELRGEPVRAAPIDVVGRMPTTSAWPEVSRAQDALDHTDSNTDWS